MRASRAVSSLLLLFYEYMNYGVSTIHSHSWTAEWDRMHSEQTQTNKQQ